MDAVMDIFEDIVEYFRTEPVGQTLLFYVLNIAMNIVSILSTRVFKPCHKFMKADCCFEVCLRHCILCLH